MIWAVASIDSGAQSGERAEQLICTFLELIAVDLLERCAEAGNRPRMKILGEDVNATARGLNRDSASATKRIANTEALGVWSGAVEQLTDQSMGASCPPAES